MNWYHKATYLHSNGSKTFEYWCEIKGLVKEIFGVKTKYYVKGLNYEFKTEAGLLDFAKEIGLFDEKKFKSTEMF